MTDTHAVTTALRSMRCPFVAYEVDIHDLVGKCLIEHGFVPKHEAVLGPGCRIDWLIDRIGIEIKKGKPSPSRVCTQLRKYAASGKVDSLIVVSQRTLALPEAIDGVPLITVSLNVLWGVSLP